MKKEIKIYDVLKSKVADDQLKGDAVFNAVLSEVEVSKHNKGESNIEIILDFKDIELINTAFLNNAIGKLFDKSQYNINEHKVFIKDMDEHVIDLLKEVISSARKKYI